MIELARRRAEPYESIVYHVADVMHTDVLAPNYDAVVAMNMVHHVPLPLILPRLATLVAPGGRLVIQDVVTRPGLRYLPVNILAGASGRLHRLLRRDRVAGRVRELYDQHGRGETYLQPSTVNEALAKFLPGIEVTHHLAWRYTAVWARPVTG
jgi:SAM-dependent methyltransferase